MSQKATATKVTASKSNPPSSSMGKVGNHSISSSYEQILHLQRTIGNAAIQRLYETGRLQAKLTIGQPNDKYEQEADRVADQIMSMPASQIRTKPALAEESCSQAGDEESVQAKPLEVTITPFVQREVVAKEEEESLQTKSNGSTIAEISPNVESRINSLRGGGQPLPETTKNYFEKKFGYDFSQVRVHTDSKSAETATSINAKAFTIGKDVVFSKGQYSPETHLGKLLLAHELTHVVQQSVGLKRELSREPLSKQIARKIRITGAHAHQIMRVVWSPRDRPPSCDAPPTAIQQVQHVQIGPVRNGVDNCVFTPLFRVPLGFMRVQVIARAVSPPPGDWRINVFECPVSFGDRCRDRRTDNADSGSISDSLIVNYAPQPWRSRNLFIRIRNGSTSPISNVRLTLRLQ